MLAGRDIVHKTLVSVWAEYSVSILSSDRPSRVWFHASEENSMKPLERLIHRVTFRSGIIAFPAAIHEADIVGACAEPLVEPLVEHRAVPWIAALDFR
jgi:hypothetical protein